MRILAFSDLHTNVDAARSLAERSAEVDLVLGAGDFATMHNGLDPVIEALSSITTPAALVCGNGERPDALRAVCAERWPGATVLHGEGATLAGAQVWGLGGAVPVTPFGAWSYDLTEEQGAELLAGCPEGAILVTHSPPYRHCDGDSGGGVRGSRAVLECIERAHPRLVACGHIHASWECESQIGPTKIVNAGPRGVVVEL